MLFGHYPAIPGYFDHSGSGCISAILTISVAVSVGSASSSPSVVFRSNPAGCLTLSLVVVRLLRPLRAIFDRSGRFRRCPAPSGIVRPSVVGSVRLLSGRWLSDCRSSATVLFGHSSRSYVVLLHSVRSVIWHVRCLSPSGRLHFDHPALSGVFSVRPVSVRLSDPCLSVCLIRACSFCSESSSSFVLFLLAII